MDTQKSRKIANYIFLIFILSFILYSIYYIYNSYSSEFNIFRSNSTYITCITSICFDHSGILECMETPTPVLVKETSEKDLRYNSKNISKITFKVIGVSCE